jgi:hypothetical protein
MAMVQKPIRFQEEDIRPLEESARLEGIDFTSYVRRCAVVHARENHPEVWPKPEDPDKK